MSDVFCYHGIGENLLRYESIMNTGILSANKGMQIDGFAVNGEGHYNGKNNISVAIPHDDNFGALRVYIMNRGISFYIRDVLYTLASETNHDSGYPDEAFVFDEIPNNQISGIIVNSNMRKKKISQLSIIGKPGYASIIPVDKSTLIALSKFGIVEPNNFDELLNQLNTTLEDTSLDFLEREKKIDQIRNKIDSELAKMVEVYYKTKLGKDNLDVMDVINHFNTLDLPILDENDVRTQCRGKQLPQRYSSYSTLSIGRQSYNSSRKDIKMMERILDTLSNEMVKKQNLIKEK